MKKGKAGGKDGITCEEIKAGGETLVRAIHRLYNLCLKYKKVPKVWYEAELILLFKKGDRLQIQNYRPISLLPVLYKTFMNIISLRIEKDLDRDIEETQTGFRKNMSTLDNILVLKQMIRRSHDYNFPLVLVCVDFKKAFDSVYKEEVIGSLRDSGIHPTYVKIFQNLYDEASLDVRIDSEERKIKVNRGIRQGDVLSGKLFIKILEKACNKLRWKQRGIKVNGRYLSILKFADDVLIMAKSYEQAEEMLLELIIEARKIGLEINLSKTKVMTINIEEKGKGIEVESNRIEEVEEYIYLGSLINVKEKESEKEVGRRIGLGWRSFNKYRDLFRSNVSMDSKRRLWNTCVLPVMIYGCETWAMPEKVVTKMRVTQRMMERSMIKISRKDRKSNIWVRNQTKLADIGEIMLERKWNWCGHIVRVKDDRFTKEMLSWYPRDKNRGKGRPTVRWDEEMRKACGGCTWQRVAYDRREWKRMREVYCQTHLYKS